MGPILVFDKSFLQSINPDEAVWLDHFFLTNITPLFFIETLADLEKEVRKGRTPEQVVGNLAYKTPDLNSKPSVHHTRLLSGELSGRAPVPMGEGQIIVPGGKQTVLDGKSGVFFEQSPEEEALSRWQKGQFLDLERQQAKQWRRGLSLLTPEKQRELFSPWFQTGTPNTLADVKLAADGFIDQSDQERSLSFGLALVGVNPAGQAEILGRWRASGRPSIAVFAPYFRHVYGVELFFYLGLAARLISERRTNHVDLAYLFYLPFCMVFTSSDDLHAATVPLFLRDNQTFVPGAELKADLGALDRHYSAFPDEAKARGLYELAAWPPVDDAFLVSRLWDAHMRPDWREIAVKPEPAPDKTRDAKLVERLRDQWEAGRAAPEASSGNSGDVDYMVVTRRVDMKKGKWNRFPPEVKPDP